MDADDLETVDEPVGADEPDEVDELDEVDETVDGDDIVDDDFRTFHVPDQRTAPDIETVLDVEAEPDIEAELDVEAAAAVEAAPAAHNALTERECQVLAFERRWWKHAGSKEQAIRDQFGMSSTRYYQVLNLLLDNPAALEHDPVLVKRLRRLRAARTRARSGGRVA
nr:DUF3263 domain-containing protein [Rugosimonospora africana]